MTPEPLKNFEQVTVATGYDAAALTLDLKPGDGAKLPAAPFNAIWWNATDYSDPAEDPTVEVVRVTEVAGDTLTIVRSQAASDKKTVGKTFKLIVGPTMAISGSTATPAANQLRSRGQC